MGLFVMQSIPSSDDWVDERRKTKDERPLAWERVQTNFLISCREGNSYFTDWMTLFDWLGLLSILCIIPLRYMDYKAQWMVTSLAFLFNFLRIFKFSCVSR